MKHTPHFIKQKVMEEVKEIKKETSFKLPNKRIKVVPIKKATAFIPDEKHQASFLAPRAKNVFVMPRHRSTGNLLNILTKEEKEYFENSKLSGLHFKPGDLSVYKKEDNYWMDFRLELGKEVVTLDLNEPVDYFNYKFLLKLPQIANSKEDVRDKATYLYYLVDEMDEIIHEAKEAELEESAWELFGDLKKDRIKMISYLNLQGKKVSSNVTDNFLIAEIRKIIKRSPVSMEGFINSINDSDFDIRVLVDKAVNVRAITRENNQYFLDGERIASSTEQLINYLKDGKNQDHYMLIEDRVNNAV